MKTIKIFFLSLFLIGIDLSFAQINKVDSLSAKDIIEKYLSAIGGRDSLMNIKDITTEMYGTISGVDITMTIYQKSPSKMLKVINAGAVRQAILYDGANAVMQIGKSKRKLSAQALEGLKYEAMLNFILNLDELKIKTEFLQNEIIDGRDTYKIKLILPSDEFWIFYFDKKTGLKIKSLKTVYSPQGTFEQTTFFSNYNFIDGINFPFRIKQTIGIQTLDFNVSSIKINSGIKDEKFMLE